MKSVRYGAGALGATVGMATLVLSLISNYGVVDYTFRTPAGGGGWSQGYTSLRG